MMMMSSMKRNNTTTKRHFFLPFLPSLRTLSSCAVFSSTMDHRSSTRHHLRSKIPNFSIPRKSTIKQTLITFLIALFTFTFLSLFFHPSLDFAAVTFAGNRISSNNNNINPLVRIYVYDLPIRFTFGIIQEHSVARGGVHSGNLSSLEYPGHQHMSEWYLYGNVMAMETKIDRRGGFHNGVVRVLDPEDADLFFVPFFSSLSLIVNQVRSPMDAEKKEAVYSDEENQDALVEWLEDQKYWRRNGGRDHVFVASDPNALYRVIDKVKNSVLLVSDFGRLRPDQGSIVKDVVIPYAHRIRVYDGDVGIENRPTLLFFMGNRYRKEGGKIRDTLFQVLEKEEDVIIKHGAQSRESRREASKGMHTSKFCLHPAGDTPSACRLFDAIVSMCIPVIVSDEIELPFEDAIDYRKIAIFVESAAAVEPGYLVSALREVTPERILEYQEELKKVKHYFQYADSDAVVNEIWRQVAKKVPLIKLMINRDKRVVRKDFDCSCLCTNRTAISNL